MDHREQYESKLKSALAPLFYTCRVFGLAPFDRNFTGARPWRAYSVALALLAVLGLVSKLRQLLHEQSAGLPVQDRSAYFVLSLVTNFCIIATIVTAFTAKRDYSCIVASIAEVDSLLQPGPCDYSGVYSFLCKELGTLGAFLALMAVADGLYIEINSLHWWLQITYVSYFINLVSPLVFVNLVRLLLTRMKMLNSLLENFGKSAVICEKTRTICKNRLFLEEHTDIDTEIRPQSYFFTSKQENSVVILNNLRRVHFKLYKIAALSNNAFGFRNLSLILCFLVTIAGVTYMSVKLLAVDSVDSNNIYHWLSNIIWLFLNCLVLLAVALLCDLTAKEAKFTAVLVQECLLFNNTLSCADAQELAAFAQQLCGYRVAFSAAGVFEINNQLLLSVAATVATYIVVLLSVK